MKGFTKKSILFALASAGCVAATIASLWFGIKLSLRGNFKKAEVFDNYRLEELTKAQQRLDSGEISQSEFDIRVSYINGLEDISVVKNVWCDEGHEDCCEKLYKEARTEGLESLGCVFSGIVTTFGAAICGTIAHLERED